MGKEGEGRAGWVGQEARLPLHCLLVWPDHHLFLSFCRQPEASGADEKIKHLLWASSTLYPVRTPALCF